MADTFQIDTTVVEASAAQWADQQAQLETCASRLGQLATTGLDPSVRAQVESWVADWRNNVLVVATGVGSMRDHLDAGMTAYRAWDDNALRSFQGWLGGEA
ncbi:hypothetical protein [Cellulomonas taurus]|uniref:hypothetical protein n=1 Tax=Cellulomonas taurus TaxID=2729175 RepID=UPI00145F7DFC|nr:hypothetical protein [Cellulomonas taurus]